MKPFYLVTYVLDGKIFKEIYCFVETALGRARYLVEKWGVASVETRGKDIWQDQ